MTDFRHYPNLLLSVINTETQGGQTAQWLLQLIMTLCLLLLPGHKRCNHRLGQLTHHMTTNTRTLILSVHWHYYFHPWQLSSLKLLLIHTIMYVTTCSNFILNEPRGKMFTRWLSQHKITAVTYNKVTENIGVMRSAGCSTMLSCVPVRCFEFYTN